MMEVGHVFSSALESGDFYTALPLIKGMTSEQILKFTLPDMRTPLHYACKHGRVDTARQLLTTFQYSIESKDVKGCTPLHTAAQYGQLETVKYLLHLLFHDEMSGLTIDLKSDRRLSDSLQSTFRLKVSHRHRDLSGNTPLHTACIHGQLDIVQVFTHEIGCDSNDTNSEGLTCLHLAAQHGHLSLVKHFMEELQSDMTLEDKHGRSPTYLAAGGGYMDILKYLIEEKGADPHFKTTREWKRSDFTMAAGRTLVHAASHEGHLNVVKYLIECHGCDLSCKDDKGIRPLYLACEGRQMNIVVYLIQKRMCDPNRTSNDGRTCLHAASIGGRLDIVKFLTNDELKCDLNYMDNQGLLPLHHASQNGHLDVVKYLVCTLHCDPQVEGAAPLHANNNTPLQLAALNGHLDVVKYLVDTHHCDPQVKDADNNTSLHLAALNGHLDTVKFFINDMKCDPSSLGYSGETPLHKASANGHLDVVKYLANTHHCDQQIMAANCYNNTPVHLAALNGHLEVVKFFIDDMKCNPYFIGYKGRVPLHFASLNGHLDVVKYLVDTCHCDPLYLDTEIVSPLHFAASEGKLEVVKYFTITHLCEPQVKTAKNSTPLHYASRNGHLEVVKFFIDDMKCNPNCTNSNGLTPLHHASENGHLDVVMYLVDTHHCDPQVKTLQNETPLHYAAFRGHLEVLKYFIFDKKCNPNAQGQFGWRPLHYAIKNGKFAICKYLLSIDQCDILSTVPYGHTETDCLHLYIAVEENNLEIVKYLTTTCRLDPLQHDRKKLLLGATKDAAILDYLENYTDPLHHAAVTGDVETVRHYVEVKKWCPNMFDRHGNSALHNAAKYGQLNVVKYLTGFYDDELICDPLLKNKRGLTAKKIASRNGHNHVVSYLLRATTGFPVSERHTLSPSINIFVLGNSGSGKSTLVRALSQEKNLLGKFVKVRGVLPLTAGVVSTILYSQVFGKVNIYDFAGHEEYYASHEMILGQANQSLVLLMVDISLPTLDVQKQLNYWVSLLSNYCTSDKSKTLHVVAIGSHADQANTKAVSDFQQSVTSLCEGESTMKFHGFIYCDCRYSSSDPLDQLRQKLNTLCRSIRLFITHHESDYTNMLCASLMYHLQHNMSGHVTITVSELHEHITSLKSPGPALLPLTKINLLIDTCTNLNSSGHLLFLPHSQDVNKSILVLDEEVILSRVHACLSEIKRELANEIGMLEENQLKRTLSNLLKDMMEPELAIKYLTFTQFCTEITAKQLTSAPDNVKREAHYFFPNLVLASRPADLWSADSFSHLYTWSLKCTQPQQFFTPLYIHTLFIQLVKCGTDINDTNYIIWKNGILLVHNNGTRSVIEVTDQTSRVYLVMQCIKGSESCLVKQRSMLISLIKSLLDKVCPKVKTEEYLLPTNSYPLDNATEIPLTELAQCIVKSHPTISHKRDKKAVPQSIVIGTLLFFDSFHAMEDKILRDICIHSLSTEVVSPATMKKISSAVKSCSELAGKFQDETGEGMKTVTFNQLYRELIQYTIFTDGNYLYELVGIKLKEADYVHDPELPIGNETLRISNLYCVRIELEGITHLWKEFGHALGLKPLTLEKIKSNYQHRLQDIDQCLTEVLASWLDGEDRPHESPGPNWKDVITALKSPPVNMTEMARQLIQKLSGDSENSHEPPEPFKSVDNTPIATIDTESVKDVLSYVCTLNRKWFHLGLSLGLSYSTLKDIEGCTVGDLMTNMLLKYLRGVDLATTKGPPSWRSLALALCCPLVRQREVAFKIQRDHQISKS